MSDIEIHWDNIYRNTDQTRLGWYEKDLTPSLRLINQCNLNPDSRILHAGSGTSTLITELCHQGFKNQVAVDLSPSALKILQESMENENCTVNAIQADLTKNNSVGNLGEVDLWHDRAVMHFFIEDEPRNNYYQLIRNHVKKGGYVMLAAFSMDGAEKCSGLPVRRYDLDMMSSELGCGFLAVEHFHYLYTMPSGDTRNYIYALFRRVS